MESACIYDMICVYILENFLGDLKAEVFFKSISF